MVDYTHNDIYEELKLVLYKAPIQGGPERMQQF